MHLTIPTIPHSLYSIDTRDAPSYLDGYRRIWDDHNPTHIADLDDYLRRELYILTEAMNNSLMPASHPGTYYVIRVPPTG